MSIVKVGDKFSNVICNKCRCITTGRYIIRKIPNGSFPIKMLVGVCDRCNEEILIPHQSAVRSKLIRSRKESSNVSHVEIRLPAHMLDMLAVIVDQLETNYNFAHAVIIYYLNAFLNNSTLATSINVNHYLNDPMLLGKSDNRFTLSGKSVRDKVIAIIDKPEYHMLSQTDLLELCILIAYYDVILIPNKNVIKDLKLIASVA